MEDSRIKAASDIIRRLFDDDDLARKAKTANDILDEWRIVAGERLAAHSRISDVKDGVLWIEADHPGWIQLLSVNEYKILRRYQGLHPELKLRAISAFVTKRVESIEPAYDAKTIPESRGPSTIKATVKEKAKCSSNDGDTSLSDQLSRLGSLLEARSSNH